MDEKQLIKISKAIADPTRFHILQAIVSAGEICCAELVDRFPFSQATVSHHLRILTESGLVETRREGQFSFFRAVRSMLDDYKRTLNKVLQGPKSSAHP